MWTGILLVCAMIAGGYVLIMLLIFIPYLIRGFQVAFQEFYADVIKR